MLFLKISNVDILFDEGTLMWKTYTTNKALPTTKQIQIVDPKEFVIAVLDVNNKIFVVYVTIRKQEKMPIYSERQAQVGALPFDKAFIEVLIEYSDYSNIFLAENTAKLPKNIGINQHAIKLKEGKESSFGPIYSLGPIELKTLKTYIKTNLVNGFIWSSKSSAGALILFNKKPNRSFCLCVDYWGLNNITIKNQYLLPLIGELLNWLGQAKRFT